MKSTKNMLKKTPLTDELSLTAIKINLGRSRRFLDTYNNYGKKQDATVSLGKTISTMETNNVTPMNQTNAIPPPYKFKVLKVAQTKKPRHTRQIVDILNLDIDFNRPVPEIKKVRPKRFDKGSDLEKKASLTKYSSWSVHKIDQIRAKVKFLKKVVNNILPHIFISKHQLEMDYQGKHGKQLNNGLYYTSRTASTKEIKEDRGKLYTSSMKITKSQPKYILPQMTKKDSVKLLSIKT